MKTIEELKKLTPVFLHNWARPYDIFSDFYEGYMTYEEYTAEITPYRNVDHWMKTKEKITEVIELHKNDHILFASYGTDNWSGDAFVLFEKDGVLYEVNGFHCSCYGLEGQWEPDETNVKVLAHRLQIGELGKDDYSGNEFHDELCEFLGIA